MVYANNFNYHLAFISTDELLNHFHGYEHFHQYSDCHHDSDSNHYRPDNFDGYIHRYLRDYSYTDYNCTHNTNNYLNRLFYCHHDTNSNDDRPDNFDLDIYHCFYHHSYDNCHNDCHHNPDYDYHDGNPDGKQP